MASLNPAQQALLALVYLREVSHSPRSAPTPSRQAHCALR